MSLALVVALSGCSNGLGNGLQIRGKLSDAFSGTPAARSADSGTVDALVAVPHVAGVPFLGGAHSVEADPGGNFEITVDQSYDHVLMFVDSTTEDPTVLGFLAMPAGADSVVNLMTSDAVSDVNTGELAPEDGEALAEEEGLATNFGLTDEQFSLLARGDDAFMNISNAWLNDDPETGVSSRADVMFWFEGSFESAATPGAALWQGGTIGLSTTNPILTDAVALACSGDLPVEIVPPANVVLNGVVYGPDAPITNANSTTCEDALLYFSEWPDGDVSLNLPGFTESLPSGWWLWNVGGEEIGFFRLDHAMPVDANDNPQVPVPTLELTETSEGVDVAVKWWVHDGSDYVPFTDLELLGRLFSSVGVNVSGDFSQGEWQGGWEDDQALTGVFFDGWTLDGTGATPGDIVGQVSMGYVLAGTQISFAWRGNPVCGNNVWEFGEVCDSDQDVLASCADYGLYEPGFVSCSGCELDTSTCSVGLTATRVSSDQLAFSIGDGIETNTVAFEVMSDAFAFEGTDVWATLSQDGALAGMLPLAPGEDGVAHIGAVGWGTRHLVAFQVQSPGVSNGTERLLLWDGPPDPLNPPTQIWEGPVEAWTVRTAQATTRSAISSVALPDDGAPLGASQRVIVRGLADAVGGTGRIDLHAATDALWHGAHVELEAVEFAAWEAGTSTPVRLCQDEACAIAMNPVIDSLVAYAPDDSLVDWEATLTFRVAATLANQSTSVAAVHDSATGLQGPATGVPEVGMFPAANALQLSMDDTGLPPSVADPTSWVLMYVTNPTAYPIVVDAVGFDVPDHMEVFDLLGWHDERGVGIDLEPTILATTGGAQAVLRRRLVVPANGRADFQAKVRLDGTLGVFPVSPFVVIGETVIGVETPLLLTFDGSESSCGPGAYYDTGLSSCTSCPTGTTAVAGTGVVDDCFPCPADTYLSFPDCLACPDGATSPEGSTAYADCVPAPRPVVTSVTFSPRSDVGDDVQPLEWVTLYAGVSTPTDHPVTELVFTLDGPDGYQEVVRGTLGGVPWRAEASDPVGAYTLTVVAFNDVGGSDPVTLDEPIDVQAIAICGNSIPEYGEECDGSTSETCADLGLPGPGTVSCEECQVVASCGAPADVEWRSGVHARRWDGVYTGQRAVVVIPNNGPDNTVWLGVAIRPSDVATTSAGPLFARLELDDVQTPAFASPGWYESTGVASLGTPAVGEEVVAWFPFAFCTGTLTECASFSSQQTLSAVVTLHAGDPNAAPIGAHQLPHLALFSGIGLSGSRLELSEGPTSPVLGGVHMVRAAFGSMQSAPIAEGSAAYWEMAPHVEVGSADHLEVLSLSTAYTDAVDVLGPQGNLLEMCADPACTVPLANPVTGNGTAYSAVEDTASVEVEMMVRWLDDDHTHDIRPRQTVVSGRQLKATQYELPWWIEPFPATSNVTTITDLAHAAQSGAVVGTLPYGVDVDATFSQAGTVDIILDRIEVTAPAGLAYQADSASWQPSDEPGPTWLTAPVIEGQTWTWYGRWRIPAGADAALALGLDATAFGDHSLTVRGYVGDVAIDTTLSTADDAPAVDTVSVQ